jgi:hypothetical protein
VIVGDATPACDELRQLIEPKVLEERSYACFKPARREDLQLFQAVLDGDHIAPGFRYEDIGELLFGCLKSPFLRRRASAAVGHLLKRMHVRQLVAKFPRTGRWRVTQRSRRLLASALQIYRNTWSQIAP